MEKGWRGGERNHRCARGRKKQAECASHLIEPRSALSSPPSPSGRLVLRRAGETAGRGCVDASGYSQQPRLIGVIHVPVEWSKPIRRQGEGEKERGRDTRRDPQAGVFGNEGIINRSERGGVRCTGRSKFLLQQSGFFLSFFLFFCGHHCVLRLTP